MGVARNALRAAALALCCAPACPSAAQEAQDWRPRIAEYKAAALRAREVLAAADDAVHSSDAGVAGLLGGCSRSVSAAREMERLFPGDGRRHARHSWGPASALCGRHAASVCDAYRRRGPALQSAPVVLAACSGFLPAWAGAKTGGP